MATVDRAVPPGSVPHGGDDRLESWKEIALYLKREVTTVQRWEKREGLPVHRHLHDRQGTVYAFKSELDAWRQRLSISSRDTTAASVLRPRLLLLTLLAAMLGVIVAWRIARSRETPRTEVGMVSLLTGEPGAELFPSLSPDGSWVVYAAGPTNNPDIFIRSVGSTHATNLTASFSGIDTEPAFSPDGSLIAFRSDRDGGGIFLIDPSGASLQKVTDAGFNPAWAPDGQRLVVASEDVGLDPGNRRGTSELWIVNTRTRERQRLDIPDGVQPAWSPDGRRIAYWALPWPGSRRDIWTVNPDGGPPVRVTDDAAIDWNPVWSSDSRYLYFISNRTGTMNLWRIGIDSSTGRPSSAPEAVTLPSSHIAHPAFSRDGTRLVWAAIADVESLESVAIDAARFTTGASETLIAGGGRGGFQVSPDERSTVFARDGRLYVSRLDGSGDRPITPPSIHARMNDWTMDGRLLSFQAFGNGKTDVWTVASDGSRLTRAINRTGDAGASVWSPDAARLAFADFSTEPAGVGVHSLLTGENDTLPRFDTTRGFRPTAWSPDQQFLAGYVRGSGGIVLYGFRDRSYQQVTPGKDFDPVWLPDGRNLLFTSDDDPGKMLVVDRTTKIVRRLEPWTAGEDSFFCSRISADGHRVFLTRLRRDADLWMRRVGARPAR